MDEQNISSLSYIYLYYLASFSLPFLRINLAATAAQEGLPSLVDQLVDQVVDLVVDLVVDMVVDLVMDLMVDTVADLLVDTVVRLLVDDEFCFRLSKEEGWG